MSSAASLSFGKNKPNAALRILLIEDDAADRLAVRRCLQKAGVNAAVEEASSASEALHHVRPDAYDCIVLDYYLPGEDGISVLYSLQRLANQIPVVVLTGQGDEDLAVEFMKAGAGDYLPKSSLAPERLVASIRHAMQMTKVSAAKRRAEDELRQQEAQFRILANAMPQLSWMADAEGSLQWCNRRWYEYTGTTLEDVKGWRWRRLLMPHEADRVLDHFRECCAAGEQWEDTFSLRRTDGEYRRFLSLAVPWRRDDGTIGGWLGTNTDITERIATEEALRRGELLLAGQKTALELAISGVHRDEVLNCIADKAQQQAGEGARSAVFLVDANGQHLRFVATAGMPEAYAAVVASLEISANTPSCGLAVYSGQPVITKDVLIDPLWAPYLGVAREHRLRSCWSFPICSFFGKVLGTLAVYHSVAREPSRTELESLKLLCSTAALVIEQHDGEERRKRAEREVRQSAERRRILSEALSGLLSADDPNRIARDLFAIVAKHIDVDTFFNHMVEPGETRLRLHSYAGIPEEMARRLGLVRFGEEICGTVAEMQQPIVARDIQNSDYDKAALVRGFGIQCYACYPLVSGNRLLGTLAFASHNRIAFDDAELEFLRLLCDYTALAIDRLDSAEALRNSEERFRNITETAADVIFRINEQSTVLFVNPAVTAVFGYLPEELIGKDLTIVMPEYLREVHGAAVARYLRTSERHLNWECVEVVGLHKNGREFPVELSMSESSRSGVRVFTGFVRDISERNAAEEAMRRAEGANAAGRMAHAMAHEINNPLEAIMNLVYLIGQDPDTLTKNRERIKIAEHELDRVSHIVKQTLGLYASTSEAVPTNVCNLIDDVLRLLTLHTTSKRLSVERRYAWSGDVEVRAEMQKAFWNLLENAVEAAPLEGKVVVRVRAAREYRGKRRAGVRISFADNGLGLDAETKSKLFDPFFSTKERKGRGLGLWIASDIVSRHGGTIRVRSSSRRSFSGTCCSVFLPLEVKSRRKVA